MGKTGTGECGADYFKGGEKTYIILIFSFVYYIVNLGS